MTLPPCALAGIKESVCWGPLPAASPLKSCEYHGLCSRFQELLLLPGESAALQSRRASWGRAVPRPRGPSGKGAVWRSPGAGATAARPPLAFLQRIISCPRQSGACATVSLAGSFEGTRPTGAVGSPLGSTLCRWAGAGSTSGTGGAVPPFPPDGEAPGSMRGRCWTWQLRE